MNTRLASFLTAASLAATSIAAALALLGPVAATAVAVLSVLAIAAGAYFGPRDEGAIRSALSLHLLIVVVVLAISSLRYLSGIVPVVGTGGFFTGSLAASDANWLVVFVIAPVSLMLLGGHFLSRGHRVGVYAAWWAALFAVADGLFQLYIEFGSAASYQAFYHVGVPVALAQIFLGVALIQCLLRPKADEIGLMELPVGLTNRQRDLWSLLFIGAVIVYTVALYRTSGPMPVAIIVGSMIAGMIGWRMTTAKRPADPAKAVPLYLLLLTFFYIHVGEETVTDFAVAIAAISGTPWTEYEFIVLIALVGPIFWFFSAWSLWKRQPFGNFVYWFLIVGMILGEPAHMLAFPIAAMKQFGIGYEYFSGMYTSLFPMIPAILSLVMIVGEHRSRSIGGDK